MNVSSFEAQIPADEHVANLRRLVLCFLGDYFMTNDIPDEQMLLVDDLGADSLDLLQVAHTLNEMFDIEIDARVLPHMLSVGGTCDLVECLHSNS